ncbi:hypothetical protein SAMN02910400_00322 [Lachnospiraceae bacterium C10]|nr:hypothetical protein SAMN02910400_00322 [Lachnospiraceae bacterium C10]
MSNNRNIIHFRDAVMLEKGIIFSAVEMNGIFFRNFDNREAQFIGTVNGEDEIKDNLHSYAIEIDENVYFIPLEGKGITIFNKTDDCAILIPYEPLENLEIICAYRLDDNILMIPLNSKSPFLLFDTLRLKYEELDKLEQNIWKLIKKDGFWTDAFDSMVDKGRLYIITNYCNLLLDCDMKTLSVDAVCLGINVLPGSMTEFDEYICILDNNSTNIITVHKNTKKISTWALDRKKEGNEVITVYKGDIYIVSPQYIYRIDYENQCIIEEYQIPEKFREVSTKYRLIAGIKEIKGYLWILTASGGGTLLFDGTNISVMETSTSDDIIRKIENNRKKRIVRALKSHFQKDLIIQEGYFEEARLDEFLTYIKG